MSATSQSLKPIPLKPGLYRHFKGGLYKVIQVATHSEDQQPLVIYQALYGDKGIWARPLQMFTELLEHQGRQQARFSYYSDQSETLEIAILNVLVGCEDEFELAFEQAQKIISRQQGYISHRLERCVEHANRYVLLVEWQTLEDHTEGFHQSADYQQWRALLHHFYQPLPEVLHFRKA